MTSEVQALAKIIDVANTQLDLLDDAQRRSEVDKGQLARSSLDFLLQAIAVEADNLSSGDVPPALRDAAARFAERERQLRATAIDVRHHLIALGDGWMCGQCKSDVVGGAVISGVQRKKIKIELQCKSCGATSPIKPAGSKVFDGKFGHLVAEGWNPKLNGFVWNGS